MEKIKAEKERQQRESEYREEFHQRVAYDLMHRIERYRRGDIDSIIESKYTHTAEIDIDSREFENAHPQALAHSLAKQIVSQFDGAWNFALKVENDNPRTTTCTIYIYGYPSIR